MLVQPRDETAEAPPVAVVTHAQAERSLGGAGRAVGRSLTIDGITHEVIGVLPPGQDALGGARASVWVMACFYAWAR